MSVEKEIENIFIKDEEDVLEKLKKTYKRVEEDIDERIKKLTDEIADLIKKDVENETIIRSKIYQLKYQQTLKKQLDEYLDILNDEHVGIIDKYKERVYEDAYFTTMYEFNKQGIPVTTPINQDLMIKTLTFNTADMPLSARVHKNVERTKKILLNEISRGIATGQGYPIIARNVMNHLNVSRRKANQLAQNEGQRVRIAASYDSMKAAKDKGADLVKRWRSTLDGKTRRTHGELDQQWTEIEGHFKCSKYPNKKIFAPKDFGIASEDINCRCSLQSVPRWDVQDGIKKSRYDNENKKFVEVTSYEEWRKLYYQEHDKPETTTQSKSTGWGSYKDKPTFKTKKEAAAYFEKDLGIKISDSRKYPVDEEVFMGIAEWQKKFSETFTRFESVNPVKLPQIVFNPPSKMRGNVKGYYEHYTKRPVAEKIALHAADHSDRNVLSKSINNSFNKGWWSSNDESATYVHEYGHHVSNSLRWLFDDEKFEDKFIKECFDEFKKEKPDFNGVAYYNLKEELSTYGSTSESECFAESFAEYFTKDEPRTFARIFGEKLVKLLKETI